MNEYEENLFGVDMRHRPPLTILPTEEHGWGGSHGRLAYSQINRAQEWNYSEYAVNTMGLMPKNYIIVNANEIKVNKDSALKVSKGRYAIPVKEYARQKRLTLKEQWELMNPQWVGTFFGLCGDDPYRHRRKTLEDAIAEAIAQKCYDEFMQQFWSAKQAHKAAVERLERRAKELEKRSISFSKEWQDLDSQIRTIESDIDRGFLEYYHLQGLNAHEYMNELRQKRREVKYNFYEASQKARRIKDYLDSITY